MCRLARAHYEHAHTNGQAPPLSALEELKSLDSKHQDVTKLISTYHGLIVKVSSCFLNAWPQLTYDCTCFQQAPHENDATWGPFSCSESAAPC